MIPWHKWSNHANLRGLQVPTSLGHHVHRRSCGPGNSGDAWEGGGMESPVGGRSFEPFGVIKYGWNIPPNKARGFSHLDVFRKGISNCHVWLLMGEEGLFPKRGWRDNLQEPGLIHFSGCLRLRQNAWCEKRRKGPRMPTDGPGLGSWVRLGRSKSKQRLKRWEI